MKSTRTSSRTMISAALNQAILATAGALTVAGCFYAFSPAKLVEWVLGPKVEIQLQSLTGWTEVRYGLDRQVEGSGPALVAAPKLEVAPKRRPKRRAARAPLVQASSVRVHVDQIQVNQAQAKPQPVSAPVQEQKLMREIHRDLRVRIRLALHQTIETAPVRLASAAPAEPPLVIQKPKARRKTLEPKGAVQTVKAPAESSEVVLSEAVEPVAEPSKVEAPVLLEQLPVNAGSVALTLPAAETHVNTQASTPKTDDYSVLAVGRAPPQEANEVEELPIRSAGHDSDEVATSGQTSRLDTPEPTPVFALAAPSAPALPQARAEQDVASAPADMSIHPGSSIQLAMNTHSSVAGATGRAPQMASAAQDSAPVVARDVLVRSPGAITTDDLAKRAERKDSLSALTLPAEMERAMYVEAFSWDEPVFSVIKEQVSAEGPAHGTQAQWVEVSAQDHWPTLSRTRSPSLESSIPLLSRNNVRLLEQSSGTSHSDETGIVFGRIPSNVALSFSGRADHQTQFGDSAGDSLQNFVLLNVEPGVHLLYFSQGEKRGAVSVPVRSGTATFLDLSHLETRTIEGRVLDGDANAAEGLANIRVSLVGHPGRSVRTDQGGAFRIENAWIPQGHPIYLESEAKTGFTHRYELSPQQQMGQAQLFRFGLERMMSWIDQLEGGLSPESGWVIGALPQLVAGAKNQALFPMAHPVEPASSLAPETYTMDSQDRLLVHSPLTVDSPRFAVAQVPAGLNLIRVEDQGQRVRWSKFIIASPGVVNVVGP